MSDGEVEWISAHAAKAMGPSGTNFTDAIIERASVGLVRAKAQILVWDQQVEKPPQSDCEIPKDFWRCGVATENWDQGDFGVFGDPLPTSWMADSSAADAHAYGVFFARVDIEAMASPVQDSQFSAATSAAPIVVIEKNPGGRPPKDWEAAMIELAGQLYDGDLKPDTQANIENAIKEYFTGKGLAIGDSTARDHARPLFHRLIRKNEN